MYHDLVQDHIDGLLREGDALRAERQEADRHASIDRSPAHPVRDRIAPRVRLGRWLVSVGSAIAGTGDDPRGVSEHVSHAA
jgi:hypothetical protein